MNQIIPQSNQSQNYTFDTPSFRNTEDESLTSSNVSGLTPILHSGSEEQNIIEEDIIHINTKRQEKDLMSAKEKRFLELILLTICLAGVQFTWTVELAYGTPYLTSLGLSNSLTALVWLAGPLSGLLIQPLVGVYSDRCTLKFGRRRPFMIGGSFLVVISILLIAYSKEAAIFLLKSFSSSSSIDLSPTSVRDTTIVIAASSFYFLDFSINAVQASCRALIVDMVPLSQQGDANAWAGRMIGLGNVIGYFIGFLDLPKILPGLGDTQMKVLCVLANVCFVTLVGLTCFSAHEIPHENMDIQGVNKAWYQPILEIVSSMRDLPAPIQSVCNVQFLAWLGWFPFLFYSTSWVSEKATGLAEGNDEGTRAGSFALLLFAIISVVTGFLLPMVCTVHPLDADPTLYPVASRPRSRHLPQSIKQRLLTTLKHFLELPSTWAWSLWIFAFLMLLTGLVPNGSGTGATVIIAACGVCWGVTQWVPFTLMGECISYYSQNGGQRQYESQVFNVRTGRDTSSAHTNANGYAVEWSNEDEEIDESVTSLKGFNQVPSLDDDIDEGTLTPTSPSLSYRAVSLNDDVTPPLTERSSSRSRRRLFHRTEPSNSHLSAGLVLGIHNIYIVLPQFISTFVSAVVFAFISFLQEKAGPDLTPEEKASYDAYGWALRVGAILSVFAGGLALKVVRVSGTGKQLVD